MEGVKTMLQQEQDAGQGHDSEILELIQSFPPSQRSHLLRWLRFLKSEMRSEQRMRTEQDDEAFWSSFGSWQDERGADAIVQELRQERRSSRREMDL